MSVNRSKGKYQKAKERKKIQLKAWQKKAIIYIITIILLITTPMIVQARRDRIYYEAEITRLIDEYENRLDQQQRQYEAKISDINKRHEYGGDVDIIEKEAEYISKVVYGMGKNHSDNDRKAIIWCILNRVESAGYPGTIKEVCQQSQQWIGYSDDNPVLEDIYNLVLPILKEWYNEGHRPMDRKFVYLSWSSEEIIMRDTFEVTKNTKYYKFY